MVGKIDEHRVPPAEIAHDVGHDAVVVARGIVVVRNDLPLQGVQVRPVVVSGWRRQIWPDSADRIPCVAPKGGAIEVAPPRGVVFEATG